MKQLLFFILGLYCTISYSQIKVQGTLTDGQKKPITDVTAFVTTTKDSTLISYTTTNEKGFFELQLKPITDSVRVHLSLMGYKEKNLTYKNLTENLNIGNITLEEDSDLLSEIVIVTDAPVRVKNDTLEFNAASFKVRPDANVEALLKKLPGVEIDADKNITVNGKKVSQILVNNKPFFNKDGSIALQNLPADLIKKVQVTDAKTKLEIFSGRKAESDNASINLTIDEEKNKGFMGKLMAGYGTDDRYESSGMINYFKGDRKISILASANNINSSGFSMDDIFDNMGGGRSQFFSFAGRNGMFSNNRGITRTKLAGFNYSDTFFDDLETNASYYYNDRKNENNSRSRTVNLLPTGEFITEAQSKDLATNTSQNANFELEYTLNPTTKILIEPSINANRSHFESNNQSVSNDDQGVLFNESKGNSHSTADSFTFENSLEINKVLGKNKKNLSLTFDNKNSKTDGLGRTQSETYFYQGTEPNDIRNQQEVTKSTSDNYLLNLEYTQPINTTLSLNIGYNLENNKETDLLNTYNFNSTTNQFDAINERLSNETFTTVTTNKPYAGVRFNKDKVYFWAQSGVKLANFDAGADYLGTHYALNRKYVTPFISSSFQYSFTKSKSLGLSYRYDSNNPSATQVLNYERFNDPLNTFVGNDQLDQGKSHGLSINFRDYNFQMRSGWSVFLSSNYYESQIVAATTFDENKKRTTTFVNVHDAYSINLFGRWGKSKKWAEHNLKYELSLATSYGLNKEITNEVLNDAKALTLRPRVSISWDYGDLLSIAPSYSLGYYKTDYSRLNRASAEYVTQNFMLQTTTYWPENWAWGNDFTYNYNSNMSGAYKPDYFLWNTSLSYTFLQKALTAKIKVYDILNQNVGTTRTVNATTIVDQENTVLKRYAMFSLTYKFDQFGTSKNKPERRGGSRMFRMM